MITNGGVYSISLPFSDGLNIIRAENSTGKSTCINAIAYGLGLEAILGPIKKRPFPKSLYDEIFDSKVNQEPIFVSNSYVSLVITNSKGKRASLKRDVSGDDSKFTIEIDGKKNDYFLGAAGQIGSAVSERGFHHWLAKFIGWNLPQVVTFDDKEAKLYLECIFPLFFIEQKRGWSEIQANIPTYYGIKNVKKSAAEFCLDIDSFAYEKKVSSNKNKIRMTEMEWDKMISALEGVSEFNSVQLGNILPINKYQDSFSIDFYYREGDALISVQEQERSLRKLIERLSGNVLPAAPRNGKLSMQLGFLRALRRELEKTTNSIELTMIEASETTNKLSALKHDLDQYHQLKRLKNVGSNIDEELDTRKCPICESDLYDTLGNRTVKREPMTLDENIIFLKSQIDFFSNVRDKNIGELKKLQSKARLVNSKIDIENTKLEKIREDMEDVNGASKSLLREKIQAEIQYTEVIKLRKILDDQKLKAEKIHSEWSIAAESLKSLRKRLGDNGKGLVINYLESIIRGNLSSFNFNPSAINSISISHQTLRPEQEGYDIVAETSASDYIRIIWAYTLALMELAGQQDAIKHGGFVVFDEPRQHEASKISFANLIEKASDSKNYGGQVIFATSLDEGELKKACENKEVNLVCFDDYILSFSPKGTNTRKV